MKLNIQPFIGQHCETTATGTLLRHLGTDLSEPMLFGLGEGLGFIYWNMKGMNFPFLGGRVKPDELTRKITGNLGLLLRTQETSSAEKAWSGVRRFLDQGVPVGLKLDCYHLEYFANPIHFAGHYVAIYGYDEKRAYLVDTQPQGSLVSTSLESLASARAEKGPMSSRHLSYTLSGSVEKSEPELVLYQAISRNARTYLEAPISNMGYRGIAKTGRALEEWLTAHPGSGKELVTLASVMERGGTGGALFRNLYRDFLYESDLLKPSDILKEAQASFVIIAKNWTEVSRLIHRAGETEDILSLKEATVKLEWLSKEERKVMGLLTRL